MATSDSNPDSAEKQPIRSVFLMEDWSYGQFYILEPKYQPDKEYLQRILDAALDALGNHAHLLSKHGLYVAERLAKEIPPIIAAIKSPIPKTTKNPKAPKQGFVYLIQSPTHAYKIGRTIDPENRMKTFSVKLPFEVEYVCVIPTENMYGLESELHQRFADKRLNGEWFALSLEDVEYIKGLA